MIRFIILFISLFLTDFIYASNVVFLTDIPSGFVSGQFVCTEVNEYGSLNYSCGGRSGDGSVRSIPAEAEFTLPDNFFNPYHNPNKIKIVAVYVTHFAGKIENKGQTQIWCDFPDYKIVKDAQLIITVNSNGQCALT